MKESYLEIVELDNGDIVLRPVSEEGDKAEPLVVLQISDETKSYLQDRYFELAKNMFHSGIDYIYSGETNFDSDEDSFFDEDLIPKILH